MGIQLKGLPQRMTLLPCNFNCAPPLHNKFMIAITHALFRFVIRVEFCERGNELRSNIAISTVYDKPTRVATGKTSSLDECGLNVLLSL